MIENPHFMISTTRLLNAILIFALLCLQSCAVVGGIFKAGVWVGIVAVIVVVLIIIFIISKISGGNK